MFILAYKFGIKYIEWNEKKSNTSVVRSFLLSLDYGSLHMENLYISVDEKIFQVAK